MKTVRIRLRDITVFIKEYRNISKIIDKYAKKIDIIIDDEKRNAEIEILYNDGQDIEWLYEHKNPDALIAHSFDDICDILNFYSKYDYKTLKRIWKFSFIGRKK